MERIDAKELWRQIPPEEKIILLNRSHAGGIFAALSSVVICGTLAVGLQLSWLLWTSLVISPLIFQFAAGKAWRDLKPRVMLEYLAARSVSRRFAFMLQSRVLTPLMIFRAHAEEQFENEALQEAMEAMISNTKDAEVWVALFPDVVLAMIERPGGAKLHFGCMISERLKVEVSSGSGGGEYSSDVEVIISYGEKRNDPGSRFKLTSQQPAALVVFEKKLQQLLNPPKRALGEQLPEIAASSIRGEPEMFDE